MGQKSRSGGSGVGKREIRRLQPDWLSSKRTDGSSLGDASKAELLVEELAPTDKAVSAARPLDHTVPENHTESSEALEQIAAITAAGEEATDSLEDGESEDEGESEGEEESDLIDAGVVTYIPNRFPSLLGTYDAATRFADGTTLHRFTVPRAFGDQWRASDLLSARLQERSQRLISWAQTFRAMATAHGIQLPPTPLIEAGYNQTPATEALEQMNRRMISQSEESEVWEATFTAEHEEGRLRQGEWLAEHGVDIRAYEAELLRRGEGMSQFQEEMTRLTADILP